MLASTQNRSPSGRSSSFIPLFLKHGTHGHRIGGNEAERLADHTCLLATGVLPALGRWDGDFHLRAIRHWQGLCEDDDVSLNVAFVPHNALSPLETSMSSR